MEWVIEMNRREAIKAAVAGISAQSGIDFTGELLTRNDDDICIVVELATPMTLQMKQNIRESLGEFLNCGIPIVVLPDGAKMRIARRFEMESVI